MKSGTTPNHAPERTNLVKVIALFTAFVLTSCQATDDLNWMMAYWEDNANHYSMPREDATRMAHACIDYDRNPRARFVDLLGYSTTYGDYLARTFHSYDPGTHRFTDSATTYITASGPAEGTNAARLLNLLAQDGDNRNANFIEKITNHGAPDQ